MAIIVTQARDNDDWIKEVSVEAVRFWTCFEGRAIIIFAWIRSCVCM